MSNRSRRRAESDHVATPQRGTDGQRAAAGEGGPPPGVLQDARERVLTLSRTAARLQSLLDPDRVMEAIGDELRGLGLSCIFCLLRDGGDQIVLRHANLDPETLQAAEALVGVPWKGLRFFTDASPQLRAVVQEGKTTFEKEVAHRIREVAPAGIKEVAFHLVELLQAPQVITAPLIAGSDTLGILMVWSENLTEEDVPAVSVFAQQAASAIERANLYGDTMQRVFELEALRKTTLDMTRQLDLPQLLRLIVERAATFVRTTGGGLYLHHPEQGELELVVSHNLGDDYTGTRLKIGEGLSGKVALTGEPLAVEDYSNWESRSSRFDGVHVRGILGVPLKWGEKVMGVLNLTDGESPRSFSGHDFWLLELFASHAAVAIENARLFAERGRRIEQLAALHEVSLEILAETDPSHLLLKIVQKATDLLDAQAGAIDLFDPESQQLEMKFSHGYQKDYTGIRLSPGEGVAGMVCQTRQPLAVNDYPNWSGRVPQVEKDEISAALGVPLMCGSELLGVLTIDRSEPHPFDDDDVQLAALFANEAAIALENARLYQAQGKRSQELFALYETSLDVVSRLEPESLLEAVVVRAVALLDGRSGDVYLHRPETGDLISAASEGVPPEIQGVVMRPGEGVAGTVLETRQPLLVHDYESWPSRSDTYAGHGFARVVGVPISFGEQFLGVLVVERDIERPRFTDLDQNLLSLLAHQAAVAIENSRLFEETRRRAEELEALYQVSTEIAAQLELPLLLDTIMQRATSLLNARAGGLYLFDSQRQDLELIVVRGQTKDRSGIRLALGEGVCGKVAQSGEPMTVKDYARWGGRSAHFEDEPTANVLAVPIKQGNTLLGAFFVDDSNLDREFDHGDLRLATLFANQAAVAIQNARLFGELERTIRQLAALQEVSLEVVSKTDLSEVLPAIVRVAAQLLDAQAGAIDLFDPDTQIMQVAAIFGYSDALVGIKNSLGEGVVGHVAEAKEPLIVEDYASWEGRSPQWKDHSVGTVMGVPLLRADQLLGVLTLDRPVSHPFDDGDLNLATLFANQAAIAIQNAQTVAATERRVAELTALRGISLQLTQSLDLAAVLDTIVSSALGLVDASDAHIFLYDDKTDEFTFGSGAWSPGHEGGPFKEVRENGLTATVARSGEPLVINEAKTHPLFEDEEDQGRIMEAIAGFPLERADKVLGVFNVAFLDPHTFDEDELRVLTLLADQAAIAIENAGLYADLRNELTERERAEQSYRAVVEHSLQGLLVIQDYRIVFANQAFAGISGYTIEELVGLHPDQVRALVHEADQEFVWGRLRRRLAGKPIPPHYEYRGIRKDGTVIWLEMFANLIEYGGAPAVQGAIVDITERRRAEEAYRTVVDQSLQGLAIVQDRRIVFANQAVADIFGFAPEEMLALPPEQVTALVHPEDQKLVWGRFQDRLAGKPVPPRYHFRAFRKDGSVAWAEMFANAIEYQGAAAVQAAIVDITERRLAEEALRESEEKYRTLFADSRDAVYITSRDGEFIDVNDSFLALVGASRDQLAKFSARDLYSHPDERTRFQAEIEAHGSVRDYEAQLRKQDGTLMETLISATVRRAHDETILGYQGIIRDVTQRKRAQEELQRSYQALRSTLEGTVNALAALAETRDPYTAGHQERVAHLACAIAEEMGLPVDDIQGISMAGLVHDIGKIQVPAEILSKPTELTDIEIQMIRTHPQTAYDILRTVEFPWPVADIVHQHHERSDGSGYPQGLLEPDVLMEARILAVADVVEAMASDRPYRPAHGIEEALAEIADNASILYDAEVVQACLRLFAEKDFDLHRPRNAL